MHRQREANGRMKEGLGEEVEESVQEGEIRQGDRLWDGLKIEGRRKKKQA